MSTDNNSVKLSGYSRLVFGGTDIVIPGGNPIPPVNIFTLLDPRNIRMLSIGVYTQADVDQMRNEAFDFFNDTYGLNFRLGFHEPTLDIYFLPNAALYQVTRQADPNATLNFDSLNKQRAGEWSAYEVGVLVIMTTNGTFTGGIRQGVQYFAGDLIGKSDYNFVEPNRDWNDPKYRETIRGYPIWPARQTLNSFGVKDTLAHIKIVDKDGNEGILADSTTRSKLLDGNWTLIGRAVFTF